jgi:hypothetical protein
VRGERAKLAHPCRRRFPAIALGASFAFLRSLQEDAFDAQFRTFSAGAASSLDTDDFSSRRKR